MQRPPTASPASGRAILRGRHAVVRSRISSPEVRGSAMELTVANLNALDKRFVTPIKASEGRLELSSRSDARKYRSLRCSDVEETKMYNTRGKEKVRAFIDSLESTAPLPDPCPPVISARELLEKEIRHAPPERLRQMLLQTHDAYLDALNEMATMDETMAKMRQKLSMVQYKLSCSEEEVELVKVYLTDAEKHNDNLLREKKKALQKLAIAMSKLESRTCRSRWAWQEVMELQKSL
ncbi:unnamed protein product [Phytomonas sp. EM1]|nr:unnamed protein product [Phytomonas sp. EM1]|eukprot:CCW59568.1 unnamed protein product [Phytomonas sp. isolate EM1]